MEMMGKSFSFCSKENRRENKMNKWVVTFNNYEAIEILREMKMEKLFLPLFHQELNFFFVETDMSEENLLKIEGIISVRGERTYSVGDKQKVI